MARHDGGEDEEPKPEAVADAVTDMKLERNGSTDDVNVNIDTIPPAASPSAKTNGLAPDSRRSSQDSRSAKSESPSQHSSRVRDEDNENDEEQKVGGEITVKLEPGQPPKLARSSSHKVEPRSPPLLDHLPDSTAEVTSKFELMDACTYSNKYMGYTEHAMDCDCTEEWGESTIFLLSSLYFNPPPVEITPFESMPPNSHQSFLVSLVRSMLFCSDVHRVFDSVCSWQIY